MSHRLSRDEFEALEQVSKMSKGSKPSACIARNAKKLIGIKLLAPRRDGTYMLTDTGTEALFVKNCIAGLRTLVADPGAKLDGAIANFLGRKSYIVASATAGQFEVTPRGHECLADITANP